MNVLRIVEALYRFDLDDLGWLRLATRELRPLLDRHGLGVMAASTSVRIPPPLGPRRSFIRTLR